MPSKNVNLDPDEILYKKYRGCCKEKGFSVSRQFEIMMGNGEDSDIPILYLVREIKSTKNLDELRPDERRKIMCGKAHFKDALGVDYKVVVSAAELP
ncbi:MAG: hypothetical protein U9N35_07425 [Euryarchaeota archaeon]|nr:hypothetical protein [Euryarchaeota archaeon]